MPQPLRPTIATILPAGTSRVIPSRIVGDSGPPYRNPRFWNRTLPSSVRTGRSREWSWPCSGSFSKMSFRRFSSTETTWRLSHRGSSVLSAPLPCATSALNATKAPMVIDPVHHLVGAHPEEQDRPRCT